MDKSMLNEATAETMETILPLVTEFSGLGGYEVKSVKVHPRLENGQLITDDQLRIEPTNPDLGTITFSTCATPNTLLVRAKQGSATAFTNHVIKKCEIFFPGIKFIYNPLSRRCHD